MEIENPAEVLGRLAVEMERFDVDEDRAFSILRRYSQDTNTKLRDVVQLLIDTRKLPTTGKPARVGGP